MVIICKGIRRELTAHRRRLSAVFIAVALTVGALAGCSSPSPVNTEGARIVHLTIASRFVHGTMPLTLVTPAGGGAHRPLLVFLHGLYYDNNSQLTDQMFAALHALGPRAPYVAFPTATCPGGSTAPTAHGPPTCSVRYPEGADRSACRSAPGGDRRYLDGRLWRLRDSPPRPGPVLRRRRPLRRHLPGEGDPVDLIAAATVEPELYGHAQLWLDVGAQDPSFTATDEQLANALHIHLHMWPGGHDFGYWNAHWSAYLGFYAHALAACR